MGFAAAGDGPTVVALHGGIVSGRLTFGPVLASWATRLRVLVPDRRGFERTPTPASGTIAEQAEDLLAFIAAHGRAGDDARPMAHVVGASFGGVVALTALAFDPSAFRSITLLEAPAFTLASGDTDLAAWRDELEGLYEQFGNGGGDREHLLRAFLADTDPGPATSLLRLLAADDPGVTLLPDDLRPWRTPMDATSVSGTGVPALVCSGERSSPRFHTIGERTAAALGAEHVVIAGVGHALPLAGRRLLDPLRTHIAHAEAIANRSPVRLEPHDPAWVDAFDRERAVIAAELGSLATDIAHIGSTAVQGLEAKPVVDLLVGVDDLAEAVPLVCRRLEALGYSWWRDNPRADEHAYLLRACDGIRTHHVHVATHGEAFWRTRVGFRDALRADAGLAADYAQLKRRLADDFDADRDGYTAAKGAFVRRVVAGA